MTTPNAYRLRGAVEVEGANAWRRAYHYAAGWIRSGYPAYVGRVAPNVVRAYAYEPNVIGERRYVYITRVPR